MKGDSSQAALVIWWSECTPDKHELQKLWRLLSYCATKFNAAHVLPDPPSDTAKSDLDSEWHMKQDMANHDQTVTLAYWDPVWIAMDDSQHTRRQRSTGRKSGTKVAVCHWLKFTTLCCLESLQWTSYDCISKERLPVFSTMCHT